jgi:hypothetical protein
MRVLSFWKSEAQQFSNIKETLDGIYDWVHQEGTTLSQTQTFEVAEDSDDLLTLCYDIKKNDSGEYILVTWNAIPAVNNEVAALKATELVGKASVVTTQFGKDDIPGYATYFWFLPNQNTFATIRFHHAVNGHANMKKYILGYLRGMSQYVYRSIDGTGEEILSYKQNSTDEKTYRPTFITSQKKLPGEIDVLRSNVQRINKVIQNTTLEPLLKASHGNLIRSALTVLGLATPNVQQQEVDLRNEMKISICREEFDEIVDNWENEFSSSGSFDVGFSLAGESGKVYWLSRSLAKTEIPLIFDRQEGNNEIVNPQSLLSALTNNKERIFREANRERQQG